MHSQLYANLGCIAKKKMVQNTSNRKVYNFQCLKSTNILKEPFSLCYATMPHRLYNSRKPSIRNDLDTIMNQIPVPVKYKMIIYVRIFELKNYYSYLLFHLILYDHLSCYIHVSAVEYSGFFQVSVIIFSNLLGILN